MTVPVEHAYGVTGHDTRLAQSRCETANPLLDLEIGEAPKIAVNDLLIRCLHARRVPQLLEDQRILISRFGGLNQPSHHGGLPRIVFPPAVSASAILSERIAWSASHRTIPAPSLARSLVLVKV